MKNNKALYIIISVLVISNLITLSYIFGALRYRSVISRGMMGGVSGRDEDWEEMMENMENVHEQEEDMMHAQVSYDKPVAETHKSSYDLGQVSQQEGVVSTIFEIENHGRKALKIGEISTSCGCTTAEIDIRELGFNEEAELTVYFDPNFHEEPEGRFTRSVFVQTNDEDNPEIQFDIFVEIVD